MRLLTITALLSWSVGSAHASNSHIHCSSATPGTSGRGSTTRACAGGSGIEVPATDLECFLWQPQDSVAVPSPRYYCPIVYDPIRHRTILFGGYSGSGRLGDTWEWDGGEWLLRSATGPAPRKDHSMAFDADRGVAVLFGGDIGGQTNDTWEWDGQLWTRKFPPLSPAPREDHALAFDAARGEIILFGGGSEAAGPFGDTWGWNGTAWTLRSLSGPSPRWSPAMAYDADRQVVVLFGGYNGVVFWGDTWEWDGESWEEILVSGPCPTAREFVGMTYDSERQVTVLLGGMPGLDTQRWDWDGVVWQPYPTTGPTARRGHGMCYDSHHHKVVLFGGYETQPLNDTWELEYGGPDIVVQPTDISALYGQSVSLTVELQETDLPEFQWRKDGLDLVDGGEITGSTAATLIINQVEFSDSGSYDVVVTNDCGSVLSEPAGLVVGGRIGDMNCDGVVNVFDIDPFVLALTNPPGYAAAYPECDVWLADIDGDGWITAFDIDPFVDVLVGG